MKPLIFIAFLALPILSNAVSLPTAMTASEVEKTVQRVGAPSTTRLLRDAEAYETWPGFKIGLEVMAAAANGVENFGAGNGSVATPLFLPRLYLSKGLFFNIDLILSTLPKGTINTLATYGGILKWTFMSERDNQRGSVAAYFGYTYLEGLAGYTGHNWEGGLVASRDFVRIKPYLGLGLLLASGSVQSSLVPNFTSNRFVVHAFLGLEWEMLANITAQVELFNLSPAASILFSKRW